MAQILISKATVVVIGKETEPAIQTWLAHRFIDYTRGQYTAPLTLLPDMLEVFPVQNEQIISAANIERERQLKTQDLITYGPQQESETNLWPHQLLGVQLARINKRFAFFYDTRTGKTPMSIEIMYEALKDGRCHKCLVVCPSAIINSWLGDFKVFHPEIKVVAYYGTQKQKEEALKTPCHVFIISTETAAKNMELLNKIGFDMCIVDESSKLKSNKSQISKAMLELSTKIEYWYILSATPAPNGEHEYYIQMRTVDNAIFPLTWTAFTTKYFFDISKNPAFKKLVINQAMKEEFMNRIKSKALYIDQSIMPTAGKEWHIYSYAPEQETMKAYNEFRKNAIIELENTPISTDMVASINAKLSQITSGFILNTEAINHNRLCREIGKIPDQQEVYHIPSAYLPSHRAFELRNLLQQFPNEQVVIWANYKQEFADIKQLLGDECRLINGSTSLLQKQEYIKMFKKHQIKYLVCHPLSVGMGINLTESHIAIYYSLTYSWEALKQSSERICGHITVQPETAQYYIMAAAGTIDEAIYKAVTTKQTSSQNFLSILQGGKYDA